MVEDTAQPYDIIYRIRYDLDYPYYNLYVKFAVTDSGGKVYYQDRHELVLLDAQTGKPLGTGLGGVYEKEFTAIQKIHLSKKGLYKIKISQYMRLNSLPGIHEFGIRISPSA
jgi:gliding motility-associated lipoprotein GldH